MDDSGWARDKHDGAYEAANVRHALVRPGRRRPRAASCRTEFYRASVREPATRVPSAPPRAGAYLPASRRAFPQPGRRPPRAGGLRAWPELLLLDEHAGAPGGDAVGVDRELVRGRCRRRREADQRARVVLDRQDVAAGRDIRDRHGAVRARDRHALHPHAVQPVDDGLVLLHADHLRPEIGIRLRDRDATGGAQIDPVVDEEHPRTDGVDAIPLLRVQLRRQGQRAAIPELLTRRARRGDLRSIPEVALITGIGGAGRTRTGAGLRRVAVAHDGPADRGLGGEGVAGTVGAAAGAVFRDVAGAVLRPAHGGGGLEGVRRARRTRPRAVLRHVTHAGRRAAHRTRRLERIGRARRTRPGAVLRHVARAGRRPADGARRLEGVRWARRTRPGAVLRRVACAGRRATDRARRLEAIGRADRARARAGLVHVAHPGRRPAHRPGVPRRVLAGVARPVALIERARVAVGGARRARRLLGVRRAAGARPGAVLRRVALARRGTAHRARRLEAIGRADRARARARLVHVAHPGRRPAHRPGVPRRVLAGVARPEARR